MDEETQQMRKTQIALVDMGEKLPIRLRKLARKLSSKLKQFEFSVESITSSKIGDPTIQSEWHDVEVLFNKLREHPRTATYDILLGLTHYKITEKDPPPDPSRKDYFSLSDHEKVGLISLNESVSQYRPPAKNLYQYAAFLLVCELLNVLARQDMMHTAANFCLFDECEDRAALRQGMKKGEICTKCKSRLADASIPQDVIKQVTRVLRWCKHNSLRHVLASTARNPLTTLALGTIMGWAAKSYISQGQFLFLLVPALIIISLVSVYYSYSER